MKLLLDQNLSHRLAPLLARHCPGTKHVSAVGLAGADDETIWRFAKHRGFAILTKDSDFMHRSIVRGHPPKIVQLQVGNSSTDAIATLVSHRKSFLRAFIKDPLGALLILK